MKICSELLVPNTLHKSQCDHTWECESSFLPLSCWWKYLLNINPQNRMHICYLWLSSILSHRLLAESLVIKYKKDNQNHSVWIKLMLVWVLIYKGIVWPTQSITIDTAVALQSFLPSLKEGFCPPVAMQLVFLVRLCFLWEYGISSHRFTESVQVSSLRSCAVFYPTGTPFG